MRFLPTLTPRSVLPLLALPACLIFGAPSASAQPVNEIEVGDSPEVTPIEEEILGQAELPEVPQRKGGGKSRVGGKTSAEATTILNVKDADIATLIKSFSRLTNRNYIIDSNVKGKVSILLPSAVTIPEALRILDSVLLLKGFTTVPVEKNTWKVIVAKEARQTTIPFGGGEGQQPSDQLVTQIIRLKNVQAGDLQSTISQFVSKEGLVNAFQQTNSLIVIDSAANVERLVQLTKQLDVPALDQDITIIPVMHAEAKDVAEKINQLLGEGGEKASGSSASSLPRVPPIPNLNQQNPSAPVQLNPIGDRGGSRRSLPAKVIPDERTNALIVVADATTTLKIRAIAEQLDSPVDKSGGRFYVYRLKHADADELSEILNGLITGSPSSPSDRSSSRTGSSLASSSRERSKNLSGSSTSRSRGRNREESAPSTPSPSPSGSRAVTGGGEGGGKVNFEGEVTIAPDPSTNALIISASRSDYLRLKEVIDELDVKRRQVVVEATILEVSLDKTQGTGVELQSTVGNEDGGILSQTNYGGLTNLLKNPTALSDLTIAAASTGTLTLPGGLVIPSQAVLVSAVSKNTNVNVLSSPTIVTTDNQEAEIVVGENVPFVTSQSTDSANLGNTFTQIERQDVGITLRITPQISAGSFVSLKIFVEISNVVDGTQNAANGPTTTVRTTETNVEVKNGQMVVTGGLIADNIDSSSRGVPYFEDIPVLGHLFRKDGERRRRTNLLIFITPRILKDQFDARDATLAKRDKVESVIEQNGTEPDRGEVLHSEDLDRVAEMLPSRTVSTTPITPAAGSAKAGEDGGAVARTQQRLMMLHEAPPAATAPSDRGAVPEYTVQPKLPNTSGKERAESRAGRPQGDEAMSGDAPAKAPQPRGGASYVVFRSKKGGTVGLVVPSSVATFFQSGGRYKERDESYICLGRYSSKEAATTSHTALQSWRELSPRESLQLGEGAWRRG